LATGAVERVSPYTQQALGLVSPYAHQAAERIAPIATSAKQRSARMAHDAVEKIGPVLDDALERLSPAVEAARDKMSAEVLPKLSETLSAAAGAPVVVEAKKRGKAAVAAAKGELELPKEKGKKKGRWLMGLAVVAAIAGATVVLVRKFLGSKDADWQAARPTTSYAPPKPPETAGAGVAAAAPVDDSLAEGAAKTTDEAPAEPTSVGEGMSAETTVDEEVRGEAAATEEPAAEPVAIGDEAATFGEAAAAPEAAKPKYEGEGVYVGSEPPEGFTIKGNERSMKYHVPESAGYGRTVAEVWFNSEEAAQQAGFVRAQR
jgi:hypothetical protein